MKLIIVESPHKSETISKFLGRDYKVLASKGHIRDLASTGKMGLGVDINNNFTPTYVISADKKQTVYDLKQAVSKADVVYLATDPDREGEAISWHLAQVLGLDVETTNRLEFHEITKPAVLKALNNPRHIDMDLVESQETRRIIDRLMGYRLSNLLQRKIKSKSAGRVQSVVLKFIVDREKEISDFVPVEYWTISGLFDDKLKFSADLTSYNGKTIQIKNEKKAIDTISNLPTEFTVKLLKEEIKKHEPNPPFITSTLQQAAFSNLHFSVKKTASVAQKLYEGKEINGSLTGLITYMRTDSTRLSDEFKASARKYIVENYGEKYLGHAHMQKADKNIQDAHEAIRPTDLSLTPAYIKEFVSRDEYQLYELIYKRALASLMTAKVSMLSTLVLTGNGYDFTTSASTTTFDGYSILYGKYEDKEEVKSLPKYNQGDKVKLIETSKEQHFTKPPVRYNEGKIVKLMQENGIGRPSTYASTVSTLIDREYINNKTGLLVPTEQGKLTSDELEAHFPLYMSVDYTAGMEDSLDKIAEGKMDKQKLLSSFWEEFQQLFKEADATMEKVKPVEVGRNCPLCGAPLVIKKSKFGEFVGCSRYSKCKYIEKKEEELSDRICPKCGSRLVLRQGKRGKFYGCSNYHSGCNYMESLDGVPLNKEKKEEIVIPDGAPLCPVCHEGHLIERTSKWGKKFIGCSNFPQCHYIQKDENAPEKKATYKRYYKKKK